MHLSITNTISTTIQTNFYRFKLISCEGTKCIFPYEIRQICIYFNQRFFYFLTAMRAIVLAIIVNAIAIIILLNATFQFIVLQQIYAHYLRPHNLL